VTGLVLLAALVAALAATGWRTLRRFRRRRLLAALPGGSRETALEVEAFSEIEDHLRVRECPCGGLLASLGERSETTRDAADGAQHILRIVRVECRRCEELSEVWFDATRAYH
jgi:hypothetical protein